MISTILGYGAMALSILGVLLLFWTWRKYSRVRTRLDLLKLAVRVAAITIMIVILSVRTPLWLVAAGAAIGLMIGFGQGRGLRVEIGEKGITARKTILGLVASGIGIAVMQAASLANRAGIVRLGMALTFLSLGVTVGLLLGRRRPINSAMGQAQAATFAAAAAAAVAALGLAAFTTVDRAELVAAAPVLGQEGSTVEIPGLAGELPEGVAELTGGIVDFQPTIEALSQFGVLGLARNEATLRIPTAGGPIEGVGVFVMRWDLQELLTAIYTAAGGAVSGSDEEIVAGPCKALVPFPYSISGLFDPATGISATITPSSAPIAIVSGCEDGLGSLDIGGPISDMTTFDGSLVELRWSMPFVEDTLQFRVAMGIDGVAVSTLSLSGPSGDFVFEDGLIVGGTLPLEPDPVDEEVVEEPPVEPDPVDDAVIEDDPPVEEDTPVDEPVDDEGDEAESDDETAAEAAPEAEPETALDPAPQVASTEPGPADTGSWNDFLDDDVDISEDDAAWAALAGLFGVSVTTLMTLAESGTAFGDRGKGAEAPTPGSVPAFEDPAVAEQYAEALRRQQDAVGLVPGAVVDENGRLLAPDSNGLFEWELPDGVEFLSRGDVLDRISAERTANASRDAATAAMVRSQTSDRAVAERFGDLSVGSIARNDRLMEEIRSGWDRVDELQTTLDRRRTALADLEFSLAAQTYELASSWDQVALDAISHAGSDVAGLPGEIGGGIVDATRFVVTAAANPENWRMAAETIGETAYDVAGATVGGGSFGDGQESVANGVRTTAQVVYVLGRHPIDTAIMMSPLPDLADAVDPEKTLGQRLGHLGLGLVDIAGTLSGFGVLSRADDLVDAARAAEAVGSGAEMARAADAVESGADAARAVDAVESGAGAAHIADELLDPDLLKTRGKIDDAILSAQRRADSLGVPVDQVLRETPEVRALFQDGVGMNRMGALEAGGGLSDEVANAVVRMHDEITGPAARTGVVDALEEMTRTHKLRPKQVFMGNSGSVGASRSVMTDADRTLLTVFSDSDLEVWMAKNPGMDSSEAADALQATFADMHQRHMELALNSAADPAVVMAREKGITLSEAVGRLDALGRDDPAAAALRLTKDNMDHASYGGMGSLSGQTDSYPAGFTKARQSIQGSTEVFNVGPGRDVNSYLTSGQALVDQNELEIFRHKGTLSTVNIGGLEKGTQIPVHDPTRIPPSELSKLLEQQVKAVDKYDDAKSVAKAVDRVQYVASRTGRAMEHPALVRAAVAVRANPRSTAAVLKELGMSEQEFVQRSREMVRTYGEAL